MSSTTQQKPVLILGTGLAALSCALELAKQHIPSLLVTNTEHPSETNTAWAQGGVAYVQPESQDSLEVYANDIWDSGDGVGNLAAIEQLTQLGNKLVREVMIDALEIPFERNGAGKLTNNHEGAHSTSRVIHVGDSTGRAIQQAFLRVAMKSEWISFLPEHTAVDLLTTQHHGLGNRFTYQLENQCCGAYLLDNASGKVKKQLADFTVLATGGIGQLFLHSTNHPYAIGSGMVMARRAGAALLFPHYIQFHPTALDRGRSNFLISEVVRGAGAILRNGQGERFMKKYHPQQLELAPRDELSRAIAQEMLHHQEECVYLDATSIPTDTGSLENRFPTISQECRKYGLDMNQDWIPVVPAAHYHCGGVKVDLHGHTTIPRLFAIGEVSCTGVHGANRLASTSLVECLTWGHQAARRISEAYQRHEALETGMSNSIRDWEESGVSVTLDKQRLAGDWSRIRTVMWNYVGIIRSKKLLEIAVKDFRLLGESLSELYYNAAMSRELVDLFHGLNACQIIVEAAWKDSSSLGCHYLVDSKTNS